MGRFRSFSTSYSLEYVSVGIVVLLSNLLWYDFSAPPITANIGFNIYPFRSVSNSLSQVNIYDWPVSYIPPTFGIPDNLIFSLGYALSSGNYGLAFFFSRIIWELTGAFSLYYLSQTLMRRYGAPKYYSLIGVLFYSFNAEILMGAFFNVSTGMLLTFTALLFLSFYRSNAYSLLLGFFAFFLLGSFPVGSLIFLVESVVVFACMYGYGLVKSVGQADYKRLKGFSRSAILSALCFGIGNLYLILPFLKVRDTFVGALTSANPTYAFSFSFDQIETLPNAIRLINNWAIVVPQYAQPWMTGYLSSLGIQVLLYIAPSLAFLSVLFLRRKSEFALYSMMLLTVFFSKANNPPLGGAFVWLISNVPPLRPFYNGASFSAALISFYSVFCVYTIYNVNLLFVKLFQTHWRPKQGISRVSLRAAVVPILTMVLLLVSVFPMLSPMLTNGAPSTPLRSSLPSYYISASDFLRSSGPNDPVMVFPSVAIFSGNSVENHTWYNGINIYPGIIENPSISGVSPLNFVPGRGDADKVLKFIYGIDAASYLSTDNYSGLPNYGYNSSLITWSPYLPGDTVTTLNLTAPVTNYLVNSSAYHAGGHWLIGKLSKPLNLTSFGYAIIEYRLAKIIPNYVRFGIFQSNGAGRWYDVSEFPTLSRENFNLTAFSLNNPTFDGGGGLSSDVSLVVNYEPPQYTTDVGNIQLQAVKFYTGASTSNILAQDMNTLGVRYAYVDTSITNSPNLGHLGNYYNAVFSQSRYFREVYQQGSVFIYENLLYDGLFRPVGAIQQYHSDLDLLQGLYYNFSPATSFVSEAINLGTMTLTNVPAITYRIAEPTNYVVNVGGNSPFVLNFKADYNPKWVAIANDKFPLSTHFEINGFSNAWVVPANVTRIQVFFATEDTYSYMESLLISLPFVMGFLFVVWELVHKSKRGKVVNTKALVKDEIRAP